MSARRLWRLVSTLRPTPSLVSTLALTGFAFGSLLFVLGRAERLIYYGAAFALILTVGVIFASAALSAGEVIGAEPLETALIDSSLTVIDRVLLSYS